LQGTACICMQCPASPAWLCTWRPRRAARHSMRSTWRARQMQLAHTRCVRRTAYGAVVAFHSARLAMQSSFPPHLQVTINAHRRFKTHWGQTHLSRSCLPIDVGRSGGTSSVYGSEASVSGAMEAANTSVGAGFITDAVQDMADASAAAATMHGSDSGGSSSSNNNSSSSKTAGVPYRGGASSTSLLHFEMFMAVLLGGALLVVRHRRRRRPT
jgi:hypothetical protein